MTFDPEAVGAQIRAAHERQKIDLEAGSAAMRVSADGFYTLARPLGVMDENIQELEALADSLRQEINRLTSFNKRMFGPTPERDEIGEQCEIPPGAVHQMYGKIAILHRLAGELNTQVNRIDAIA